MDQLLAVCIFHPPSRFPLCSSDPTTQPQWSSPGALSKGWLAFSSYCCHVVCRDLKSQSRMVVLYITLLCLEFLVSIISNPFLIPRWLSRLYHISDYVQLPLLFIEMLCSLHPWAWVDGFVVAFSLWFFSWRHRTHGAVIVGNHVRHDAKCFLRHQSGLSQLFWMIRYCFCAFNKIQGRI